MDDGNLAENGEKAWKNYIRQSKKKSKLPEYPREISGERVYDDICDQIEGKENGTYLVLSKFEEDVVFEYHITVSDDNFNLGI